MCWHLKASLSSLRSRGRSLQGKWEMHSGCSVKITFSTWWFLVYYPSEIGMWEGLCVFCPKWNGPRDALTQKKAGLPCSGLNAGSYFILQDEGMTESPAETLEKARNGRSDSKSYSWSLSQQEIETEMSGLKRRITPLMSLVIHACLVVTALRQHNSSCWRDSRFWKTRCAS